MAKPQINKETFLKMLRNVGSFRLKDGSGIIGIVDQDDFMMINGLVLRYASTIQEDHLDRDKIHMRKYERFSESPQSAIVIPTSSIMYQFNLPLNVRETFVRGYFEVVEAEESE